MKAFIVIMDGQMPNWKTLDVFPSLFYFSLMKLMRGTMSRKYVSKINGQVYWNHQLPVFYTPPSLTVCLSLSFITYSTVETWEAA